MFFRYRDLISLAFSIAANSTAHCNLNKRANCAIWSEGFHGRKGNDIAADLFRILNCILQDFPNLKKMVLWSDSCVPQNTTL